MGHVALQSASCTYLPDKATINGTEPCLGGVMRIALISTIQLVREPPDHFHGLLQQKPEFSVSGNASLLAEQWLFQAWCAYRAALGTAIMGDV